MCPTFSDFSSFCREWGGLLGLNKDIYLWRTQKGWVSTRNSSLGIKQDLARVLASYPQLTPVVPFTHPFIIISPNLAIGIFSEKAVLAFSTKNWACILAQSNCRDSGKRNRMRPEPLLFCPVSFHPPHCFLFPRLEGRVSALLLNQFQQALRIVFYAEWNLGSRGKMGEEIHIMESQVKTIPTVFSFQIFFML